MSSNFVMFFILFFVVFIPLCVIVLIAVMAAKYKESENDNKGQQVAPKDKTIQENRHRKIEEKGAMQSASDEYISQVYVFNDSEFEQENIIDIDIDEFLDDDNLLEKAIIADAIISPKFRKNF